MSSTSPSVSGSLSPSLPSISPNFTPSPPPAPTGSSSGAGGNGGNGGNQNNFGSNPQLTSSASLYLYTFLATIVLLLLVSITIVARSYALRRRHQAAVAEAIANGTYVPPKKPGVGEKPKMYEVYLGDEGEETEAFSAEKEKEKQREQVGRGLVVDWDRIMPIACRWLNPPGSTQSPASTPAPTAAPTPATIQRRIRLPFSIPQLRIPGTGRRRTTSSSASVPLGPISAAPQTSHSRTSVMSTEKPPLTPEPPEEKVRVAVLISMPFSDPSRKRKSVASTSTTEAELPYVEFGTAEVPAGGLSSILEAPAASPLEQIAVPPPVAGSHMNV